MNRRLQTQQLRPICHCIAPLSQHLPKISQPKSDPPNTLKALLHKILSKLFTSSLRSLIWSNLADVFLSHHQMKNLYLSPHLPQRRLQDEPKQF